MRCLTGVFISPRVFHFTSRFTYQHVGIQNARENERKTRENARKIKNASPTRDNVSILHYALGKNASQLRFSCVLVAFWSGFGRVLVGFWSGFDRVLVAFWSRLVAFWSCFGHKHCQNANPTHSVIRP